MYLYNFKTDIVEYILKIRTNDIYNDLLKLELLIELSKIILTKYLLQTKGNMCLKYENGSFDYKVQYNNINYNPGLQNIMMLYNIFLNKNIVIIHIKNYKIIYKSNILHKPLLIEIILIMSIIYKKLFINNNYDIYVNGLIKKCDKNNISYYIIDYIWEYYHICKLNNEEENISLNLYNIRDICNNYNKKYKDINLEEYLL